MRCTYKSLPRAADALARVNAAAAEPGYITMNTTMSLNMVALSLNLIFYFLAIRSTGVAVAIFLSYLAPVYLAFVAQDGAETWRVARNFGNLAKALNYLGE